MSHSLSLVARRGRLRRSALILIASVAPLALDAGMAHAADAAPAPADVASAATGEIVVSAQRRDETLNKVPLSIAAYSQKDMDVQGVRSIDDIARITPALQFSTTSGVAGNNGTNIAIRGLKSDVGSSTTAIYIDDTPIQIRNIGY